MTPLRPDADSTRAARAAHLHGLLKAERWSVNAAALALGIPRSTLYQRLRGETPLMFDDVEMVARLLKRDHLYVVEHE
ncbi:MAG: hypothetical protein IE935_13250, partial [Micrococcales bacterium]|nr:hypothetical protein [Micrococcales bacterium]